MFRFFSWVEDTIAVENGTSDTPEANFNYDSEEHISYMLDQLLEEEQFYSRWGTATLQDLYFSKLDYEYTF